MGIVRAATGGASALMIATLAACTHTTPRLDSQFGSAVRTTLARQVLNPDAGAPAAAAAGMDGRAARAALERYQSSFGAASSAAAAEAGSK
jgi:hypothetical protein